MVSVTMNSELLLFSSFFIAFLIRKMWKKIKTWNLNLPPGPRKLPIIGNMHQFVGCLLHHKLGDMAKKYGPVMQLQFGEVPIVVISSEEASKEVLKTHDILFAQRPVFFIADIIFYKGSDIVFEPYGENWRQLRKICVMELLNSKRVQLLRSLREEEVSNLIGSISSYAGSPVNLSKMVFSSSCSLVARATFGRKSDDQKDFAPIADEVVNLMAGFSLPDLFPSIKFLPLITGYRSTLKKLHQRIDKMIESIINEHKISRATPNSDNDQSDLVHAILNLQENGTLEFPLTHDNIKAIILDMSFLGGIDTMGTVIEWTMSELIRNPRVMQKAQAEVRKVFNEKGNIDETSVDQLKYLKLVAKESMRLHPPGTLLGPRVSSEHCKINGYDIPSNTRILINASALARDPNHWIEPDKFYPERFLGSEVDFKGSNYEFLPFGAGRRVCPGVSFAMTYVELTLACLLNYFDWELGSGMNKEDLDMSETMGSVVRRKKDLYVIPNPCHKLPLD